ncbi:FHA domain-containing protein [bacterium]|nr:FHA domain-containing protein [bacterium]
MMKTSKIILDRLPRISSDKVEEKNKCIHFFRYIQEQFQHSGLAVGLIADIIQPAHSTSRIYKIEVKKAERIVNEFLVGPNDQILIGRSSKVTLQLSDENVSGVHCRICQDYNGRLFLTDLNSRNGTRLNDKLVSPFRKVPFQDSSLAVIGLFQLRITDTEIRTIQNIPLKIWCSLLTVRRNGNSKTFYLEFSDSLQDRKICIQVNPDSAILFAACYFSLDVSLEIIALLPEELKDILMQECLQSMLERINRRYGSLWTLKLSWKKDCSENDDVLDLVSTIKWCGWFIPLDLQIGIPGFANLISKFPVKQCDSYYRFIKKCLGSFSTRLSLVVAECSMDEIEYSSLMPKDFIMLELPGRVTEGVVHPIDLIIQVSGCVENSLFVKAECTIQDGQYLYKIVEVKSEGDIMMSHKRKSALDESSYASQLCETKLFDMREVKMLKATIELGRMTLSCREFAEISPGSVLKAGVNPDDLLEMRINDEIVARGRLVLIDEELGLEIIEKRCANDLTSD